MVDPGPSTLRLPTSTFIACPAEGVGVRRYRPSVDDGHGAIDANADRTGVAIAQCIARNKGQATLPVDDQRSGMDVYVARVTNRVGVGRHRGPDDTRIAPAT